jgi:hypothetical protein
MKTILEQIKDRVIKYVYFSSEDEERANLIVGFIQNSRNTREIIKHISYWDCRPYMVTPEDFIDWIINDDYDPTKEL